MKIAGIVVNGRTLGRTLGFPTANIALTEDCQIENGVYISRVVIGQSEFRAVSNVGVKPTVGGGVRALESHILEFEGDLYGQYIEIELLEKLRDEQRFDSIEALRSQIERDVEAAKKRIK